MTSVRWPVARETPPGNGRSAMLTFLDRIAVLTAGVLTFLVLAWVFFHPWVLMCAQVTIALALVIRRSVDHPEQRVAAEGR